MSKWNFNSSNASFSMHRYVPNELRGGMISLSLAPSNAAILFFVVQVRVSNSDHFTSHAFQLVASILPISFSSFV